MKRYVVSVAAFLPSVKAFVPPANSVLATASRAAPEFLVSRNYQWALSGADSPNDNPKEGSSDDINDEMFSQKYDDDDVGPLYGSDSDYETVNPNLSPQVSLDGDEPSFSSRELAHAAPPYTASGISQKDLEKVEKAPKPDEYVPPTNSQAHVQRENPFTNTAPAASPPPIQQDSPIASAPNLHESMAPVTSPPILGENRFNEVSKSQKSVAPTPPISRGNPFNKDPFSRKTSAPSPPPIFPENPFRNDPFPKTSAAPSPPPVFPENPFANKRDSQDGVTPDASPPYDSPAISFPSHSMNENTGVPDPSDSKRGKCATPDKAFTNGPISQAPPPSLYSDGPLTDERVPPERSTPVGFDDSNTNPPSADMSVAKGPIDEPSATGVTFPSIHTDHSSSTVPTDEESATRAISPRSAYPDTSAANVPTDEESATQAIARHSFHPGSRTKPGVGTPSYPGDSISKGPIEGHGATRDISSPSLQPDKYASKLPIDDENFAGNASPLSEYLDKSVADGPNDTKMPVRGISQSSPVTDDSLSKVRSEAPSAPYVRPDNSATNMPADGESLAGKTSPRSVFPNKSGAKSPIDRAGPTRDASRSSFHPGKSVPEVPVTDSCGDAYPKSSAAKVTSEKPGAIPGTTQPFVRPEKSAASMPANDDSTRSAFPDKSVAKEPIDKHGVTRDTSQPSVQPKKSVTEVPIDEDSPRSSLPDVRDSSQPFVRPEKSIKHVPIDMDSPRSPHPDARETSQPFFRPKKSGEKVPIDQDTPRSSYPDRSSTQVPIDKPGAARDTSTPVVSPYKSVAKMPIDDDSPRSASPNKPQSKVPMKSPHSAFSDNVVSKSPIGKKSSTRGTSTPFKTDTTMPMDEKAVTGGTSPLPAHPDSVTKGPINKGSAMPNPDIPQSIHRGSLGQGQQALGRNLNDELKVQEAMYDKRLASLTEQLQQYKVNANIEKNALQEQINARGKELYEAAKRESELHKELNEAKITTENLNRQLEELKQTERKHRDRKDIIAQAKRIMRLFNP